MDRGFDLTIYGQDGNGKRLEISKSTYDESEASITIYPAKFGEDSLGVKISKEDLQQLGEACLEIAKYMR